MKKYLILFISFILLVSMALAGSQQTSLTSAQTIITRARYYLNEDATVITPFWSDTELLAWVNHGTMDIVGRTRSLENSETISLLAGTVEYAVTGPYLDISTVIYTDQNGVKKGLVRKNPQSIGHSRDNVPTWWYEWNGKVGVFPVLPVVTKANLSIGSTATNIATSAFAYVIKDKIYTKAAIAAGTAPGTDVVPQAKYGAVALDINAGGVITAYGAYSNAVGYATASPAIAALPPVSDGTARLGYVTVIKSDGPFTFGTTDLNAANVTAAYTDSAPTVSVYFVDRPTEVAIASPVLVPAVYDRALTLYVAAQALLKEGQYAKSGRLISEYLAEIDRYRLDFVEQRREPESDVTR